VLIHRGADKSLAFPISYFSICSTTKIIFLGWVKEVRTTKSQVCGAQGGICRLNILKPVVCCFHNFLRRLMTSPCSVCVSVFSCYLFLCGLYCMEGKTRLFLSRTSCSISLHLSEDLNAEFIVSYASIKAKFSLIANSVCVVCAITYIH
jgi:hypothetical protein